MTKINNVVKNFFKWLFIVAICDVALLYMWKYSFVRMFINVIEFEPVRQLAWLMHRIENGGLN